MRRRQTAEVGCINYYREGNLRPHLPFRLFFIRLSQKSINRKQADRIETTGPPPPTIRNVRNAQHWRSRSERRASWDRIFEAASKRYAQPSGDGVTSRIARRIQDRCATLAHFGFGERACDGHVHVRGVTGWSDDFHVSMTMRAFPVRRSQNGGCRRICDSEASQFKYRMSCQVATGPYSSRRAAEINGNLPRSVKQEPTRWQNSLTACPKPDFKCRPHCGRRP